MSHHQPSSHLSWLAIAGSTIVLAGCSSGQQVKRKPEEVKKTPVKLVTVEQSEVQRTTLQPATVHACYRTEIRANASGFVKELKVDIGDYVEEGAELALIDVPEMYQRREIIKARIRRLLADEQRSEAGIKLSEARIESAKAKFAEAESLMGRAEAALAASEAEFNRTQDMVQRGSLQDRILDEVRKKRDSDRSAKDAVASSIDS